MNLQHSITIQRPVETTFAAFTADLGRWWPLKQFSFGRERSKEIQLEGKIQKTCRYRQRGEPYHK